MFHGDVRNSCPGVGFSMFRRVFPRSKRPLDSPAKGNCSLVEKYCFGQAGVGLGWVSACPTAFLSGSTGPPPPVLWSHGRPDR